MDNDERREDGVAAPENAQQSSKELRDDLESLLQQVTALEKTEANYQAVFEQLADGIIIHDSDGNILDVNTITCKRLGYSAKKLQTMTLQDLVSPEEQGKVGEFWADVLDGEIVVFETTYVGRKGPRICEVVESPIEYRGATCLQSISRDVTERRRAEKELAETHEKYRTLFEDSLEGMSLIQDGKIVDVNAAWLKLHGYSRKNDVVGLDILELIHPEDRTILEKRRQKGLRGEKRLYQVRDVKKDASVIEVELYSFSLPVRGKETIITCVRDITDRVRAEKELKESDEKYRSLFEDSLEAMSLVQDGKIVDANKAWLKLHGFSRKSDVVGLDVLGLVHPEDRGALKKRRQTGAGPERRIHQVRDLKKDGSVVDVELYSFSLPVEGKDTIITCVRDVSQRVRVEGELQETDDKYRSLFEDSLEAMSLIQDGKIVDVNRAWLRMHGYGAKKDVVGTDVMKLVHPEDRKVLAKRRKAAGRDAKRVYQVRDLKKDGSAIDVELYSFSLPVSGKQTIVTCVRDVTDRVRAERALQESDEKYRSLFEDSLEAMSLVQDGKLVDVNDAWLRLHGYRAKKDVVGKDVMKFVHPSERTAIAKRRQKKEQKERRLFETRDLKKDGAVVDVELYSFSLPVRGKETVITCLRDISDRKQVERELEESDKKYEALFEDSLEAMSLIQDGKIVDVNGAWLKMHGFSKKSEVLGKSVTSVMHPEDRKAFKGRKAEALKEIKRIRRVRDVTKDGDVIDVELYSFSLPVQGKPTIVTCMRDITELKKAEKAREENEKKYVALFEDSREAMSLIQDGTIVDANKAWLKMHGFANKSEVVGMDVLGVVDRKDRRLFEKRRKKTSKFVSKRVHQAHDVRKDGTVIDVELYSFSLPVDGKDTIVTCVRDITQRKQAEDDAAESSEKYRLLFENSFEGMSLIQDGKIVDANKTWVRMHGYDSKSEVVGMRVADIVHPEDRGMFAQRRKDSPKKIRRLFQARDLKKDGTAIDVELYSFSLPVEGKETIITCVRDISERVQVERELGESTGKYRALFEDSLEAMSHIQEGKIVDVNKAWLDLHGFADKMEVVGVDVMSLVHPDDRTVLGERRKTRDREPRRIFQVRDLKKDGTTVDVELYSFSLPVEGKDTIITCVRDVSERNRIEGEREQLLRILTEYNVSLENMNKELEESNKELEKFAQVVAHDLQEPLRMVSSYMDMLSERYQDKLDKDANEFIDFAVNGTKRMQKLIDNLLDYSKAGKGVALTRAVEMESVLEEVLKNLETAVFEANATVTHDELPEVTGDDAQLCQLLQNLISNAIKFRGEEPPRVHVASKRKGNVWIFSVHDNGIGLDPKYAQQIFGMFQRLHSQSKFPGSGIGLATCKKIVERHGGHIWVESEPGKGATFFFTVQIPEEERSTSVTKISGKTNLLIVDDNEGDARLVQDLVKRINARIEIHWVDNGQKATEFLTRKGEYGKAPRPDLVLLDLNMPVKSGHEVLAEMKVDQELKTIPVAVLTTSKSKGDIIQSGKLQATWYITKPVDAYQLVTMLNSIKSTKPPPKMEIKQV